MKTIVIGGGVVGATSAYFLSKYGHEVTLIEQRNRLGEDATGGNAGLITPGHAFAWASPEAPLMLIDSLRGRDTSIRVRLNANPRFLWWGAQFLRECTARRYRANTLAKLSLGQYGQEILNRLADEESIEYFAVHRGVVYLYRNTRDLELGMARTRLMSEHGQEFRRLGPGELVDLDPAFEYMANHIAGAIYCASDASGNSSVFTQRLSEIMVAKYGAHVDTGVTASRLVSHAGHVTSLLTDAGEYRADNFVIALGVQSPFLSRTVGQDLPVFPAKGYSLTVDLTEPSAVPIVGGVDEKTRVAWSRFGDKLRMSSSAIFHNYSREFRYSDFDNIFGFAKEMFPDAADWSTASMRACMRPMTPDGPPIIGCGPRHDNLYYNTGHGHMGWTMACGSSRILADVVVGRQPRMDISAYAVRSHRGRRQSA